MNLTSLCNEMRVYQPIPFEEFKDVSCTRPDTPERYEVIKNNYGSFEGKRMYDLCSANCYFGFRFLQDGGSQVIAVEIDNPTRDFVNALADEKNMDLICYKTIDDVMGRFDIGIYLDTHYHEGTDKFLPHIARKCDVIFTSACEQESKRYEDLLRSTFDYVDGIFQGYNKRMIYKCW